MRLRALTAQNEGDPGWGGEKTSSSLRSSISFRGCFSIVISKNMGLQKAL